MENLNSWLPHAQKICKIRRNYKLALSKNCLYQFFGQDVIDFCISCYANIRPSINNSEGINPFTIESLAFGNCIIASDVPKNIEALGDAAIFYPKNEISSLKEKLYTIEKNYEMLVNYRKKAIVRAKLFSWKEN